MAVYEFNGFKPVIKESSFIHPLAAVIGNVIIGENVYVGPGAAIRGDWGQIIIEDGCNVQENCTIHMFPGTTTRLKKLNYPMRNFLEKVLKTPLRLCFPVFHFRHADFCFTFSFPMSISPMKIKDRFSLKDRPPNPQPWITPIAMLRSWINF
jgi:hypothetical protein